MCMKAAAILNQQFTPANGTVLFVAPKTYIALAFPRYDGRKTRLSYLVPLFTIIIITWTRYVVIYFTSAIHCTNLTICCIQCDAVWIFVYPVGSFTVPCPDVGVGPRGVRGSDVTTSIVFNQEQAVFRTPNPCHNTDGLQMFITPCNMVHTGILLYTCFDFMQSLWPDFWKRWCELWYVGAFLFQMQFKGLYLFS
jgi:hypothetical protein